MHRAAIAGRNIIQKNNRRIKNISSWYVHSLALPAGKSFKVLMSLVQRYPRNRVIHACYGCTHFVNLAAEYVTNSGFPSDQDNEESREHAEVD